MKYLYQPQEIEPKWQDIWEKTGIFRADTGSKKPKYYSLIEFPYPSGEGLHVGHVRSFTAIDIVARYKRMNGFNVLYPIGFDEFGLPAENFAIKNKISPRVAIDNNVENFKRQLKRLGLSFDWSREVRTADPKYYKWTQWIFLKLLEHGLAYREETLINWCPFCKTGLANEEVEQGRHERCGNLVTKKKTKQWILKITDYANRLIEDLNQVDYLDRISSQQINWIGKSHGLEIDFASPAGTIKVFTTRADTIYGATFLVLAPEHPLSISLLTKEHKEQALEYIKEAQGLSDLSRQMDNKQKTGIFTGSYAINPANNTKIPIYIADYVLMGYGSGAIMAVPAHDKRDFDFATKYNIDIIPVIEPIDGSGSSELFSTDNGTMINSGQYNGLDNQKAKDIISQDLISQNKASSVVNYKLRDWIFSRQRYWGEPIPVIHCNKCGIVPVPEADLPVLLPEVESYQPTETGESPLANIDDWVNVACPKCSEMARRETDTMPNWAGSSWYYLRYMDPNNDQVFASKEALDYWGQVDLYNGGMEHTTLHLLYSRFWHKFLYDIDLVPYSEPYAKRRSHGMVLAADGKKMSKSLGNVVSPDQAINDYSADSLRMYEMFMGPYSDRSNWSQDKLGGIYKYLLRLYTVFDYASKAKDKSSSDINEELIVALNKNLNLLIKKVSADIEALKFNTIISSYMEFTNNLYEQQNLEMIQRYGMHHPEIRSIMITFIKLLAPVVPFLAEELYACFEDGNSSVHLSSWPQWQAELINEDITYISIQVNGKFKAQLAVDDSTSPDDLESQATAILTSKGILKNFKVDKIILISGKVINFVGQKI